MNQMPTVTQSVFGKTLKGEQVELFVLRNTAGMEVKITNFGGIITALKAPDARGNFDDVVLGFDKLEPYLQPGPFLGALIGRFGNRLANAQFQIDGKIWQLEANDGTNHLHGGFTGFDKKLWDATPVVTENAAGLMLSLLSEDGDQGYPGNLQVTVNYQLTNDNTLVVDYHAVTDQATPINLTQHTYFNLAGNGDVLQHQLMVNADRYTPVTEKLIPTGELAAVSGTPFDFRIPKAIGEHIEDTDQQLVFAGGYDHNYVLNQAQPGELVLAARASEATTGRVLEVWTEEPGMQFYSGNFLDGSLTGKGKTFARRTGFCLETQNFPDAPNQPGFPSAILQPGEEYRTKTLFKFLTISG